MLWEAVDRIVDRARGLDGLRAHRLELLAARRLRAAGQDVPAELADAERRAGVTALVAREVLTAVRDAATGPVLVFKGPEAAALYSDPHARSFTDLDLLTDEPARLHAALRGAGFEEIGDPRLYEDIHHLRPLALPHLPLPVEIHARPKWVEWHPGPSPDVLLRHAVPSATGIEGLGAPAPEHHALLLAAHSWAHEPLRRIADLVDIAAAAEHADAERVEELAAAWGLGRVWRTTRRAIDALVAGRSAPPPRLLWARNVFAVRERTVLESHLESWLSPYAALPPHRATAALAGALVRDLTRDGAEPWRRKVRRSARAVAAAGRPRSEHDRTLERIGADAESVRERVRRTGRDPA